MREIIITLVLTVFLIIMCTMGSISSENQIISYILNLIPLIIPAFLLWHNAPKILLKFSFLLNRDLYYNLKIKLIINSMDNEKLECLVNQLLQYYPHSSKSINKKSGDLIYIAELRLNNSLVEIRYLYDDNTLFISNSYDTTTTKFKKRVKKFYENIQQATRNLEIQEQYTQIDIEFSKDDEPAETHFSSKLFSDFNNYNFELKYTGKHGSNILLQNNSMQIKSFNLDNVISDISSEFNFILFNR